MSVNIVPSCIFFLPWNVQMALLIGNNKNSNAYIIHHKLAKMDAGKTQLVNPDLNAKENAWKKTLRFIEFVLIKLSV